MKIRRYIGKDTHEALLKVKMDLGSEAVILNTRKIRQKGFFKIFSKPLVEVLASVDDSYVPATKRTASENRVRDDKEYNTAGSNNLRFNENSKSKSDEKEDKIHQLENKIIGMEATLNKIYEQIQQPSNKLSAAANEGNAQSQSKVLDLFYNNLLKNEVDMEIVTQLISVVRGKVKENVSVNETASILYNLISEMIGKPSSIKLRDDGKPTVIMLVGPTGVGKTTTLAKIAANYSLNQNKNVGLITADTYRIAAVEQLKTYAEILGMPLKVIYSVNEIHEAINEYSDKDLILIDTAGRSYKNKDHFDELKMLVEATQADEIFLVLSTTTGMKNCREIIEHYSFLENYKLIFTKLDESSSFGLILNSRRLTNRDLSFVTTGQSVPDDIELANVDMITKNLLGSIS
ncbi:MAG TPA: flagellar biosynthesis protein FlhF [Acetivibrio sp.]|uniref:flagellar biosynthesis protein FlhF n=1 Tax=Acetivibrio sp. TaxID=1872092 RepID=UPI002C0BABC6|nr:flagellar biosynthesis protein FlhF [Acetivibrio sp.]HOM02074.1 flagellar biosynthesis protein FlhF [Acetivibrio sp.]